MPPLKPETWNDKLLFPEYLENLNYKTDYKVIKNLTRYPDPELFRSYRRFCRTL